MFEKRPAPWAIALVFALTVGMVSAVEVPAASAVVTPVTATFNDVVYSADSASVADGASVIAYTGVGGAVTIPASVTIDSVAYAVTSLGYMAFMSKSLTSISLPATLTTIANKALYSNYLTEIAIPATVTSIGEWAIGSNRIASIVIPHAVTTIGYRAFYQNGATSLTLGDSVQFIGQYAFTGNSLSSVIIPNSVTLIANFAFQANALTSLTIGNSVSVIGTAAFDTNLLTSVSFPDSMATIGDSAFSHNRLTSTTFGNGPLVISDSAFVGNQLAAITIPAAVSRIGAAAFTGNPLKRVFMKGTPPTITDAGAGGSFGHAAGVSVYYSVSHSAGYASPWHGYSSFPGEKAVVSFNLNGHGAAVASQEIGTGEPADAPTEPAESRYRFAGWYTAATGGSLWDFTTTLSSDTTLFAHWVNAPTISGVAKVGSQLTAISGTTAAGSILSYQWKRGGLATVLGTDSSYVPTSADRGQTLTVTITSTSAGSTSTSYTSDPTGAVASNVTNATVTVSNIVYAADSTNVAGGASVTGYTGAGGVVVISATARISGVDYAVTSIGNSAFDSKGVTSVSIPHSVTSIGDGAFSSGSLTTLTIPDSVTSIGDYAFYLNNITTLVFPNSVTHIGAWSFQSNQLTSITLPDALGQIADGAFNSNRLTSLTIPETVTTIGSWAFSSNLLTSLVIPDSVTYLFYRAFSWNPLSSLTLGSSLIGIDQYAFYENSLTTLIIPNSVTLVSHGAFYSNRLTQLTLGNSLTYIGESAFANSSLTTVVIPDTVTAIGGQAFYNNRLTSVTLGSQLRTVNDGAFGLNSLTAVTIPRTVTSIGAAAFQGNPLKRVFMQGPPPTITAAATNGSFGPAAGVTVFYSASYPAGYNAPWRGYSTTQGDTVWVSFDVNGHGAAVATQGIGPGESADVPADPSAVGQLFVGWFTAASGGVQWNFDTTLSAATTLYAHWDSAPIPVISGSMRDGATLTANPGNWIVSATFSYQWKQAGSAIVLGTGSGYSPQVSDRGRTLTVTVTGTRVGFNPQSFTSAPTVPVVSSVPDVTQTVSDIVYSADSLNVAGGASVTGYSGAPGGAVVIPASVTLGGVLYAVTGIGDSAFAAGGLTAVTIPNSVTEIGDSAFVDNTLTGVTIPNSVLSIGNSAFKNNQLATLTIPNSVSTVGSYAFSTNQLTSVALADSLLNVSDFAFANNNLATVVIPGSWTTIPIGLFSYNQLVSLSIPSSVTSIQRSAFESNQLTAIEFPSTVTAIGQRAFRNNQLTTLTIPNSVTSLGSSAFSSNKLTSATISNSITTIGAQSFANNLLTSVSIPRSVTVIDIEAFAGNQLTSVTIPASVTDISGGVFDDNPLSQVFLLGAAPTVIPASAWGSFGQVGPNAPTVVYTAAHEADYESPWQDYATMVGDTVTVSYDANGYGTAPAATATFLGTAAAPPIDPSAVGVVFAGWYTESFEGALWNFGAAVTADITFFAHWERAPSITIVGTAKQGQLLSADLQNGSAEATLTYQWRRVGDRTVRGTGATYTLGATDRGHALTVTVITTRAGFSPKSLTSAPTTAVASLVPTVTATINSIVYSADNTNVAGGASATGYTTSGGDPVIPATVTIGGVSYAVTSIGDSAFYSKGLISVSIPNSVTSIGDGAFHTNFLTAVVIPNSVTSIGAGAFQSNAISSLVIPSSITHIATQAFTDNTMASVTIPASVTSIGAQSFANNLLTTVTIPGSVTTIGVNAFVSNLLTTVTIPSSVTSLGEGAFAQNLLTAVSLPASITQIPPTAFAGNLLASVAIPDSVVGIGNGAFANNRLVSVSIPQSVTSVGVDAFSTNFLTSVAIPNSIATISASAFYDNKLVSVSIPDSVTSIGNGAFGTNSLEAVTIHGSVGSIGPDAFSGNPLKHVFMLGAAPTIFSVASGMGSFGAPEALTIAYTAAFASGFTSPWQGYSTVQRDKVLLSFDVNGHGAALPNQQLLQGDAAAPPAAPSELGYVFAGWFTTANGGSLWNFATTLSANKTLFAHWDIAPTISGIAKDGELLTANPRNWGSDASFSYEWKQVGEETVLGTNSTYTPLVSDRGHSLTVTVTATSAGVAPQSLMSVPTTLVASSLLDVVATIVVLEYSADSTNVAGGATVTAYNGAGGSVVIPAVATIDDVDYAVTSIGNSVFSGKSVTSVSLPSSVTTIGNDSFTNNLLTSVVIGPAITSIGAGAFSSNRLRSVSIPASVTSVGARAFDNNSITSVSIPQSISSIAQSTFSNNLLTSVAIPSSVISIATSAFSGNRLTSVTIPKSVTLIGPDAFGSNLLTQVLMPYNAPTIEPAGVAGSFGDGVGLTIYYSAANAAGYSSPWQGYTTATGAALSATATFDANGRGVAPAAQTLEVGATAATPTEPFMAGYLFTGWYTAAIDGDLWDFSTPLTSNTTLFAHWIGVWTVFATPTVSAVPKVGVPLAASPGAWNVGATLGYSWRQVGADAVIGTASTYTPVPGDVGHALTVTVTGTAEGYLSKSLTSVDTAATVLGTLTLKPVPTISGTAKIAEVLSAGNLTWDAGVTLTYEWRRSGSNAVIDTADSHTAVGADVRHTLTVAVTGTRDGYTPVTTTSLATAEISSASLVLTPVPTVSGTTQFGQTLTATNVTWDTDVVLTYAWRRSGSIAVIATTPTYVPVVADVARTLIVTVTGTLAGYPTVTRSSDPTATIAADVFTSAPKPTVTGIAQVNDVLTVDAGTWAPSAALTYAWKRSGVATVVGTLSTYTPVVADVGRTMTVTVTATLPGFTTTTSSSDATATVISALPFTTTSTPTISGTSQVGRILVATPGTWSNGASLAYEWKRVGSTTVIATTRNYTTVVDDLAQKITVSVTGTKAGYVTVTKTSTATGALVAGVFASAPTPIIVGTAQVNRVLTIDAGTWSPGATFTYVWKHPGSTVTLGTGATFKPKVVHLGKQLIVTLVASSPGYKSTSVTSVNSEAVIAAVNFTATPIPTVGGIVSVGQVLTAVTGAWSDGAILTYQWKRVGSTVTIAKTPTYVPLAADVGTQLTVTVVGSGPGFNTVKKKSRGTVAVTVGTFASAPVPTITGTAQVGEVLTAASETWSPIATPTFAWKRSGSTTVLSTAATYTPVVADVGKTLTVATTGVVAGYVKTTRTSSSTVAVVAAATFAAKPRPTISGTAKVGQLVTAISGLWSNDAVLTYAWKRSGSTAVVATTSTYLLSAPDLGKTVTVSVTGRQLGFATTTMVSVATTAVVAGTFTSRPAPVVTGIAQVNHILTADPGEWSPVAVVTFAWKRQGSSTVLGTSATYIPTGADIGKTLTVTTTGTLVGYATVATTSVATSVVIAAYSFSVAPIPVITNDSGVGTPPFGSVLTAQTNGWDPSEDVTFSYVWKRASTATGAKTVIAGASESSYLLLAADRGKYITVTVTATKAGFTPSVQTSAAIRVAS